MWYGKAPGLDRSCDAIRHANAWGTSAHGGVLLVVGDDPAAKSSSLSSQSEFTLQDMMVPILSPSDVQDVLDFAVLGWEMSRASGLWVGLKALADHMDSSSTVEVGLDRYESRCTELRGSGEDLYIRREDAPLLQEARTLNAKIPAAIKFARTANLNRWVTKENSSLASDKHNGRAKLGIAAAGKAYRDVREALAICGLLTVQDIRAAGVEILKLGMTWPMDSQLCVDFAESVGTLLVVEEKRAFVETQIKEVLYGESTTPVLGKHDGQQQPLIPQIGVLEVDELCAVLCELLDQPVPASIEQAVNARKLANKANAPARSERTPLFCAGCPHNTST